METGLLYDKLANTVCLEVCKLVSNIVKERKQEKDVVRAAGKTDERREKREESREKREERREKTR